MTKKPDIELLSQPLYTYPEADYLAGATRGTAKRWLSGYTFLSVAGRTVQRPPVTVREGGEVAGVSFLDLVEVVAIGGLKDFGLNLQAIRRIVANCQELFAVERPLVSLKFKGGGREVFVDEEESLVEVLRGKGQRAWDEVLRPFIDTLDYDNELARRWWPLGKEELICLDPDYAFGLPVIHRTGVRTETILERLQVGESRDEIAADFNIEPAEVESALRFEASRFKRAA